MKYLIGGLLALTTYCQAVIADNDERPHPTADQVEKGSHLRVNKVKPAAMDVLADAIGARVLPGYRVVAVEFAGCRLILMSSEAPPGVPLILLRGARYVVAVAQADQDAPLAKAAECLQPQAVNVNHDSMDFPSDDGVDVFWDEP